MGKVLMIVAVMVLTALSQNRIEVKRADEPQTVRVAAHLSGFHNAAVQMAALENE